MDSHMEKPADVIANLLIHSCMHACMGWLQLRLNDYTLVFYL